MQDIISGILEAYEKLLKEKVIANSVMIDNSYVKVRSFAFTDGTNCLISPMMIGGLKVSFTDLPDGVAFYVYRNENDESNRRNKEIEIEELKEKLKKIQEIIGE